MTLIAHPPEGVTPPDEDGAMARNSKQYLCSNCSQIHGKWSGRCDHCTEWGTLGERPASVASVVRSPTDTQRLCDVDQAQSIPVPTTVEEIDRVLGGGFVPGSVTLLSGEPGIGKSTLALQLALRIARSGAGVVLVSGEEAPAQVAARASRIHQHREMPPTVEVLDTVRTESVIDLMERARPQMLVVDSVQMLTYGDDSSSPGSANLLRTVAGALADAAKALDVSLLLIGHVTKDGSLAGPRTLEHLVDTVLSFEGDRSNDLRFLRSMKHRFGPTNEVGLFEMAGTGLRPVADASARFLADRNPDLPGTAVVPVLDGRRPVMVEIQALVRRHSSDSNITSHGVPRGRLNLVGAVARQYLTGVMTGADILVSAAGGAKVTDPGADLAMLVASVSAQLELPLSPRLAVCGEIGLSGELRRVSSMERRLHEAYRLGFNECIVPRSCPDGPTGLNLRRCATIMEAIQVFAAVPT